MVVLAVQAVVRPVEEVGTLVGVVRHTTASTITTTTTTTITPTIDPHQHPPDPVSDHRACPWTAACVAVRMEAVARPPSLVRTGGWMEWVKPTLLSLAWGTTMRE